MNEKDRITVHICTYNRPAEIGMLLQSLREQTFQEWDLIIIDQSDTPIANYHFLANMINRMRIEGHKVILERSKVPGVVTNRNQAFEMQEKHFPEAEWSCRIDDDSVLDKSYLRNLIECAKDFEGENKKVGGVQGVVPLFGAPETMVDIATLEEKPFCQVVWKDGKIESLGDDAGMLWNHYDHPECLGCHSLVTHHLRSSFLINNKAAKEVGYYDTAYGGSAFREESDFSFKLLRAGYELFSNVDAIAWHNRGGQGGLRAMGDKYSPSVQACDNYFRKKWEEIYEKDEEFRRCFE